MPSWIQTVVLDWLAKLTFTSSDVRKVKEDTEEKAAKFLELFKTRRASGTILFTFILLTIFGRKAGPSLRGGGRRGRDTPLQKCVVGK